MPERLRIVIKVGPIHFLTDVQWLCLGLFATLELTGMDDPAPLLPGPAAFMHVATPRASGLPLEATAR